MTPHKYARFHVTSAVLDLDAWTTDATTAAIVYRIAYAHGRTSDLTITGHTADCFDGLMNTLQRLNMVDDILAHAPLEMVQDWAGAWLEELEDDDLRAVRRAFVPQNEEATA
jgi:hypothetical protein